MKHNREKQTEALNKAQAKRKEIKREQVLKAIEVVIQQGAKLTFKNIADVAGCSVSYLYKWDDIKAYIHEVQKRQNTTLNELKEKEEKSGVYSLKTLHEVAKDRIRQLEAKIEELERQNKLLRGHVAEIHELKDENQRLHNQLKEHLSPTLNIKVVPINKSTVTTTDKTSNESELISTIKALEIKVGKKLREEIEGRDLEQVKLSIKAFEQYRASHDVKHQEACLLQMIKDEAQPNTRSKTKPKPQSTKPEQAVVKSSSELREEKVSLEELSQLSTIFNTDK